jgi:hypothetical protein
LAKDDMNGRLWPKADHRERLESTQIGHSGSLMRTSVFGSQSGRSIAATSWAGQQFLGGLHAPSHCDRLFRNDT